MNREQVIDRQDTERLQQIGAIFDEMGIRTPELAAALRTHLTSCSGGKACLEKLIAGIQI